MCMHMHMCMCMCMHMLHEGHFPYLAGEKLSLA